MKYTLIAAALMPLFQAASASEAQDTPPGMQRVVVVGTMPLPGVDLDTSQIAAPVQGASAADIARSQALDLSAFLNRNMGSVHVNEVQNNPFQPDVSYRGYTASPLLGTPQGLSVYMDGVRMNQPFGDVVSWDLIPRAAIESLTLMAGSNPLFGLNTLGGALSIRTKDGRGSPGTALQASIGSGHRRAAEFEHGGSNAQGLHWYATANRFKEDGWRTDSSSDVAQLFGKLGWADARTELAVSVALADNVLTGNGLQEQRLLERDYASVYTKPDLTANKASYLNFSATHKIGDALRLAGNAYYRKIKTSTFNGDLNDDTLDQSIYQPGGEEREALAAAGYTGVPASGATAANTPFPHWRCIANVLLEDEPAEKCNGLINRSATDQDNAGLSGQFTWQSRSNTFTGGAALDTSRAQFRQSAQFGYLNADRSITPVDFFADGSAFEEDGTPIDSRVDLDGRIRTWSVFASDTLALGKRWHLTMSGRYNRTTVKNRDRITPVGSGSLSGDHRFSRFNPALGLAFAPGKSLTTYAGYTEGSRTPTAIELGCADPANPCRLPNAMAGDPPLHQVVTKTWEAGLRGTTDNASWRAGVFRSQNVNDILFVADDQAGFGYFKNFGKTRHQGLELGLDGEAGALSYGASLTFMDATYQSEETVNGASNSSNDAEHPGLDGNIRIVPGKRIPLTPRQVFKAHGDYDVGAGWVAGMGVVAVSGAYARGNENNLHQATGLHYPGAGRSAGYAVFDLSLRYRATPQLSFFAKVGNLFDRKYASAAQLGANAFDANGNFVARPYPEADGAYPLQHATFYAPGAPRTISAGMRYAFGKGKP